MSHHDETHDTSRQHWDEVYAGREPDAVSWFQPRPDISLELVARSGATPATPIIDVGGGASTLADHLLDAGHRDLTVLDLSPVALEAARQRLGARATQVDWRVGDVTAATFERRYGVWHDRAVFHFLTDAEDQRRYVERMRSALLPGGHAIVATFALDGPTRCSGLPVARYDVAGLHAALGRELELVETQRELHTTPQGREQRFVYVLLRAP